MRNKLLAAGIVFGLIAGGTFAVGAVGKDDSGREVEFEYEQESEHGVEFELERESEHGVEFELERESEHGVALVKTKGTDDKKAIETAASISFEKAAKIAKTAAKGKITKAEAEMEHGRIEYEFELKDGKRETEVKIDGTTGKILEIEIEDERDDDKTDDY
ncbi:PepSY domain-containing protein [Neobacillus sp. SCS-31]|uniref:PepSY domain-containing protein n=1 Tax=Neobacillus oceani TaxID=3115292 RepID=UPI003905B70F